MNLNCNFKKSVKLSRAMDVIIVAKKKSNPVKPPILCNILTCKYIVYPKW